MTNRVHKLLKQDMDELRITEFDRDRADALRRIWFVGDVHGEFKYLAQTLLQAQVRPRWIVFVGDWAAAGSVDTHLSF